MPESKKIAFILIQGGSFPPDIRVEKEARACREKGYRVVIFCGKARPAEPEQEEWEEAIRIVRKLPPSENPIEKIKKTFTLVRSRWGDLIDAFIREERPDLLHVHDLPCLPTVLEVNRRYGIPLIADMHENWPALLSILPLGIGFFGALRWRFVHNPLLWRYHEKRALLRADHVIAVCEEARERILKDTGIEEKRVSVVSNTENEETVSALLDEDVAQSGFHSEEFVLLYTGGVARHRGLGTAIEAVSRIRARIPGIRLVIVGTQNPLQKGELEKQARRMGVESRVDLVDWVPASMLGRYIRGADFGLVPHLSHPHTNTTIPHKIFQYMALGKPVIVSSCPPLRRVVECSECGYVFRAGDAHSLAETIKTAFEHRDRIPQMGSRARQNAFTRFSWDRDKRALQEIYGKMLCKETAGDAGKNGVRPSSAS